MDVLYSVGMALLFAAVWGLTAACARLEVRP